MKNIIVSALATILVLASPSPILADNPNWSPEKKQSVETNRELNSGLGNRGETYGGGTIEFEFDPDLDDRDRGDRDPGNSGSQCQGGKNSNTGGCS